jgi:hypothetical protein
LVIVIVFIVELVLDNIISHFNVGVDLSKYSLILLGILNMVFDELVSQF